MKRTAVILALLVLLMPATASAKGDFSPVDQVNALVGTMSQPFFSQGNIYPAIGRPWGTHLWTPQTAPNRDTWTYTYTANKIRGIKMTHQPSPWVGDYGQFSLMPVTTAPVVTDEERASWFTHKAEIAKPYYYNVFLAEHETTFELTPTMRAARVRITYPEREQSYLVVDAFEKGPAGGSEIRIEGNRIYGISRKIHNQSLNAANQLWFVIESDTPFETAEVRTPEEGHAIALVGFKTTRGQKVNLKAAASFISADQAEQNLKELDGKDFDAVMAEGRAEWNSQLGRIRIEGGTPEQQKTFYSCLYRSILFPHDLSEITADGRRVHRSPHDGKVHDGYLFTDTGFWDTFRCLFGLLDLVWPAQAAKVQESLVNHYLESGFLPEWCSPGHCPTCMIGNNSASVVSEAWAKGLRGYDIEKLWEALKHGAHAALENATATGRLGWEEYDKLGYVPCDIGIRESAARTLEYAYDDWCIWSLGKQLGKSEAELAPYAKAALNYRNLYRQTAGMMSGRNADGTWPVPFNPFKWGGDFTEGNALQYTWSVFHDPSGLASLMGGWDEFAQALDNLFELPPIYDDSYYGFTIHEIREMQVMNMGNYAHGNQPAQHVIYLYDWCGQPWKAQARVREAMDKLYHAGPDGYCGDEDNGQTSAWYIFSAMGFYPVCPASAEYALGSPLFDKVTITTENGKKIEIKAKG
ncbi:MAG: GH92 family glycosyl hydrolase, partial [Bacteroidales bacterium]|nr:GH92 family glycosyl hydrolase [Bacteroidales bacterium]